MRIWVALACLVVLSACSVKERAVPVLEPVQGAQVWPPPPEIPRYAYAGTLTGEADFISKKEEQKSFGKKTLEFIIGFIFGEPDYLKLVRPVTGLVDARGRVLVTDMGRPGVVVFDFLKKDTDLWQEASEEQDFVAPVGITEDGFGGYFVTDSQLGEIFHLDAEGRPLKSFGKRVVGRPTGIVRDPATGDIFVTDTQYHRVVVFSAGGEVIDILGSRGTEPGRFNFPTHLAVSEGHLYVADSLNFRVQVLSLDGEGKLVFGELGANIGDMMRPKGVAVGGEGRIYVIESYYDHILIFDNKGRFLMPIDGAKLASGSLYLPSGVWLDKERRVYVADMFNGRICIFKELTRGDQ
ncbi:MAG: 6-bladed beta-propeller [Alphaproteobacteria bacterium]